MLKHLKKVVVRFSPGDAKAASARELLQRLTTDKAKKSNPGCVVEFKIDEDGALGKASVDLTFVDNEQRQILTAEHGIEQIAEVIQQKAGEMELRSVFKEVGYDPWKKENRLGA